MEMVVLTSRLRRGDGMSSEDIIHTIGEQLSKGRVLFRLQTTGEHTLTAPSRPRHQCAPKITNDDLSTFRPQRLPDGLSGFGIRPSVFSAATSVNTSIRARLFGTLVLIYGWGGDNDDAWVVRHEDGVGEDGEEVFTVGLQRDVLVADPAEMTGVVGTKEEGLATG